VSGSGRGGLPNKKSLLARADMDRLGINPIEYLNKVFVEAMKCYESSIPSDRGDSRAQHLSVASQAASQLASYYYPKLSAIAIKDMTGDGPEAQSLNTKEAIKVIESDPFRQHIETKDVVSQINSNIETPILSKGEGKA
jgi:hypothetical protein